MCLLLLHRRDSSEPLVDFDPGNSAPGRKDRKFSGGTRCEERKVCRVVEQVHARVRRADLRCRLQPAGLRLASAELSGRPDVRRLSAYPSVILGRADMGTAAEQTPRGIDPVAL